MGCLKYKINKGVVINTFSCGTYIEALKMSYLLEKDNGPAMDDYWSRVNVWCLATKFSDCRHEIKKHFRFIRTAHVWPFQIGEMPN